MFTNSGVNKVFLIGRIDGEPVLKDLDKAEQVLFFRLVTTELIKDGKELTEHHHIRIYREAALSGKSELKKGQMIYLEGKIKTRSYYDEQQIKRYVLEIIVTRFSVLANAPVGIPCCWLTKTSNHQNLRF